MLNYSDIIDISLPLKEGMITYPNNPAFEQEEIETATSVISSLHMGSHTGTHVDAPRHAIDGAPGVDAIGMHHFIGPCRVIDMTGSRGEISADELALEHIRPTERILLKTNNSVRGFDQFYDDFVSLSHNAATYLADIGPLLVGIDSLSIRQKGSVDNTPHTALLQRDIPIVEGLDLSAVEPGVYSLVVLPLRIVDGDGAPARAVLLI